MENETGLPLNQLLVYVERAVRGDRRLRVGLFRECQRLSRLEAAPPEERRLGETLSRILMGDRSPDLITLPDEMADEIRDLLARLPHAGGSKP
jgi:hypothetical protein